VQKKETSCGDALTSALQVFLNLKLFTSLVFDAVVHALIGIALSLANVIVVGVIAVAVLADHLASVLLFLELRFGVRVDKLHHVDDVLAAARARRARVGAESETDKVLGVEHAAIITTTFHTHGHETGAAQVLDLVVGNKGNIAVLFQMTGLLDDVGLSEELVSGLGVGGDVAARDERVSGGHGGHEGEGGGTEHHCCWYVNSCYVGLLCVKADGIKIVSEEQQQRKWTEGNLLTSGCFPPKIR